MNHISDAEKEAIKTWTDIEFEYRKIKAILEKTFLKKFPHDDFHKYEKIAINLLNLFDKIEDEIGDRTIYRGDIIENDELLTGKEIYDWYLSTRKVGDCISLGKSILSFSLIKDIAENAPYGSDKYSNEQTPTILYILNKRKSKFINISKYSEVTRENEILCSINKRFKVLKIKEYPHDNHLEYYIDEY